MVVLGLYLAAAAALSPLAPMRSSPIHMAAPPPPPLNKGYGARPSAAVEQGGSFYVPGLEGARVRIAGATVLTVGLVLNRVLSPGDPTGSQTVSEALGALSIAIIFAQSAAQQKQ